MVNTTEKIYGNTDKYCFENQWYGILMSKSTNTFWTDVINIGNNCV